VFETERPQSLHKQLGFFVTKYDLQVFIDPVLENRQTKRLKQKEMSNRVSYVEKATQCMGVEFFLPLISLIDLHHILLHFPLVV